MDKKKLLPQMNTAQYGNQPLPPPPEPVKCDQRPECVDCTMPAHGFVCHFANGNCLRFPKGMPDAEQGHEPE